MDILLLKHSIFSVLLILFAGICLGYFFQFIRNFVARHNPFGAGLINYITFPGVMHHELSHALLAFLTYAKVTEVKLFRLHHKDGALGYVAYAPRGSFVLQSIQKVATSIAPILCGCITSGLLWIFVRPIALTSALSTILFYYVFISIILHMSLSKQDIKVMKGGLLVVILLMTLVFYFLGVAYDFDLFQTVVTYLNHSNH